MPVVLSWADVAKLRDCLLLTPSESERASGSPGKQKYQAAGWTGPDHRLHVFQSEQLNNLCVRESVCVCVVHQSSVRHVVFLGVTVCWSVYSWTWQYLNSVDDGYFSIITLENKGMIYGTYASIRGKKYSQILNQNKTRTDGIKNDQQLFKIATKMLT